MEISLTSLKKTITNTLHRYHVIIFTIFVLGGLTVVVFLLNNIIIKSGDSSNYAVDTTAGFDKKTIERIKQLNSRDEPADSLDLSGRRSNPFVE